MFEYLFEKQGMTRSNIGIAGDVIDDTEDIVIPVSVVDCSKYLTEDACVAPCHWWGNACHSEPEVPPEEFPWWIVAVVAGVAIVGGIAFAMFRK